MSDFTSTIDSIPLNNIDEKGEAPESRIRDVAAMRAMFAIFRDNDEPNAKNRAITKDQLNGATPFVQKELDNSNLSDMTNIALGGTKDLLKSQMAPFWEALNDDDNLVSVETMFGDDDERPYYNEVIADEVTRTIKAWAAFQFEVMSINMLFLYDGLGVGYFPECDDWRFKAAGLGEFYFPRQSFICEDQLPVVCAKRSYGVIDLWKNVKNEEVAKASGWNVKATKRAIHLAATNISKYNDWEAMQDQLKNNDLSVGSEIPEIPCVAGFIEEFDGSITYVIFTETEFNYSDGTKCEDFLYQRRVTFSSMQEAFTLFTVGLGTNRKTHGVRGIGQDVFPLEQLIDRFFGSFIDCALRGSNLVLETGSESSETELSLTPYSNVMMLPNGVKVAQVQQVDLERSVIPALNKLESVVAKKFGNQVENSFNRDRKTKTEMEVLIDQNTKVSNMDFDFWFNSLERLFRQVVRRMSRKSYMPAEPGGREIAELRKRILKREVPLEAFYKLDHEKTKVIRAIGLGSRVKKAHQLDQLAEIGPAMDDEGQHNLLRDRAVAAVGSSRADRYVPRSKGNRVPPDMGFALLENILMVQGSEIPVLDGQKNSVHAEAHIFGPNGLQELWKSYSQGQMPIEEYATKGRILHGHASMHVEKMSGDMLVEQKAATFRQALQQLGQDIGNGIKAIQSAQKQQAEESAQKPEGQQQGERLPQGPTVEQIAKFEEHQANMRMRQEEHDLKMNQMMQAAHIKNTLADAKMAADIANKLPGTRKLP